MPTPLRREITADESRQFRRDGVVCLRDIIAPEWIEHAREGAEDQRRAPSPYATVVDAGELYVLVEQLPSVSNPKLRRVARESGAADVAKALLGVPNVRWMLDQLFYKGAGPVAETPWHQDTPYGFVDSHDVVRVWMPLDHVPRETTLEVVRGSHLWNVEYAIIESIKVLEEHKDETTTSKFNYLDVRADDRPKLPDIEAHRDSFDIVGFEVNPDDVVAFNYHILHHAGGGMNPHEKRRAFAVIYGDDRATMKHRPNPVPMPLDLAGIAWRDGQRVSDFPELFPAL